MICVLVSLLPSALAVLWLVWRSGGEAHVIRRNLRHRFDRWDNQPRQDS